MLRHINNHTTEYQATTIRKNFRDGRCKCTIRHFTHNRTTDMRQRKISGYDFVIPPTSTSRINTLSVDTKNRHTTTVCRLYSSIRRLSASTIPESGSRNGYLAAVRSYETRPCQRRSYMTYYIYTADLSYLPLTRNRHRE